MERYRMELTLDEWRMLDRLIDSVEEAINCGVIGHFDDRDTDALILLANKLKTAKLIKASPKRKEAAAIARDARSAKVKEKIQNAINWLRMEDREITPYAVAKTANISYNTARKYLDE